MSLLNDMLRDLSHQQKATETMSTAQNAELEFNPQEQRELFHNSSTAKPLPRTLLPSFIVFALVFLLLLLWKLDLFSPVDPALNPANPVADVPAPLFNSISAVAPVAVVDEKEEHANLAVTPANQSNHAAEENLSERISELESAIINLTAVVANTSDQADHNITDKDFGRSEIDSNELSGNENDGYDANTVAAEKNVSELSEQEQAEALADKQLQSVRIQEPFVQPQVEQGESHLSIAPNAKWKDEQQALEAVELLAQGQAELAVEKLQNFISVEKQPRESMKALLDIFVAQENSDAVRNSLAQASYLSVVDQTFYAAKVAIIQQDETQAIQLLETHLDEAEKNENYRSLLAGLYQRTGAHLEAANHYRRLLSVFGDKPAYWLGFALAQDSLNQGPVAAQAYQRVNQYADLQPQVRTYIQQRIAGLQQ